MPAAVLRAKGNSFTDSLKKGGSFTAKVMKHAAETVVDVSTSVHPSRAPPPKARIC